MCCVALEGKEERGGGMGDRLYQNKIATYTSRFVANAAPFFLFLVDGLI